MAEATSDIKAPTIAKVIFDRIVTAFGVSGTLLSDRETNFLSLVVKHLCGLVGTKKINTSSYHPATNGQNELLNRILYNSLSAVVSQQADDLDEYLQASLFAYQVTPSLKTTDASPFQLIYGQHLVLSVYRELTMPKKPPSSVRAHLQQNMAKVQLFQELAVAHLEENKTKMKEVYDNRASSAN